MKKTIRLIFVGCFLFFTNVSSANEKLIALCFDDGPRGAFLMGVLPFFDEHGVLATFFPQGWSAHKNQSWISKIGRRGHHIENHSWEHDFVTNVLKKKGAGGVCKELNRASELIQIITGRRPKYFRPPFWVINTEIEKIVNSCGYTVVKLGDPDINTLDYEEQAKKRPPEFLIERVRKVVDGREKRGIKKHVLVFHELPLTLEAMKILIPELQNRGYRFVTMEKYFEEIGK